ERTLDAVLVCDGRRFRDIDDLVLERVDRVDAAIIGQRHRAAACGRYDALRWNQPGNCIDEKILSGRRRASPQECNRSLDLQTTCRRQITRLDGRTFIDDA